jgi:molybdenum cofactor guanylyltransferase
LAPQYTIFPSGIQGDGADLPCLRWYHFPVSSRAGYVLVGGKSSRMGQDKAVLPAGGRTLVELVAGTVSAAAGPTALVGGARRTLPIEFGFVRDLYPGEGPLGGILSALQDSAADWNLIVACDMPRLEADFLRRLLDTAEQGDIDALLPAGPSGLPEPLCAAYHRRCYRPLAQAFGRGVRKISTALEEVRAVVWPVQEALYFQNVNTPEDWAAYDR